MRCTKCRSTALIEANDADTLPDEQWVRCIICGERRELTGRYEAGLRRAQEDTDRGKALGLCHNVVRCAQCNRFCVAGKRFCWWHHSSFASGHTTH